MNIKVISFCPITCRREKGDCDTVVTSSSDTPRTTKRRERLAGSTLQRGKKISTKINNKDEKRGDREVKRRVRSMIKARFCLKHPWRISKLQRLNRPKTHRNLHVFSTNLDPLSPIYIFWKIKSTSCANKTRGTRINSTE